MSITRNDNYSSLLIDTGTIMGLLLKHSEEEYYQASQDELIREEYRQLFAVLADIRANYEPVEPK